MTAIAAEPGAPTGQTTIGGPHSVDVARARRLGASTGLAVALPFAAIEVLWAILAGQLPQILLTAPVPTVVAGWVSGRMVGRAAAHAKTGGSWALVIAGQSVIAVVVGATLIALLWSLGSVGSAGVEPLLELPRVVVMTGVLTLLGVLVVGPFALIPTFIGALIWAWVMRRRLSRAAAP